MKVLNEVPGTPTKSPKTYSRSPRMLSRPPETLKGPFNLLEDLSTDHWTFL